MGGIGASPAGSRKSHPRESCARSVMAKPKSNGNAAASGALLFTTRRRDRDQKRAAVLNAAAELFLTQGYSKTRLDDVSHSLSITKPALYNYFKSKHDILLGCH